MTVCVCELLADLLLLRTVEFIFETIDLGLRTFDVCSQTGDCYVRAVDYVMCFFANLSSYVCEPFNLLFDYLSF